MLLVCVMTMLIDVCCTKRASFWSSIWHLLVNCRTLCWRTVQLLFIIFHFREKENLKRREEAWGKISQLAHNNPLVRTWIFSSLVVQIIPEPVLCPTLKQVRTPEPAYGTHHCNINSDLICFGARIPNLINSRPSLHYSVT